MPESRRETVVPLPPVAADLIGRIANNADAALASPVMRPGAGPVGQSFPAKRFLRSAAVFLNE